MAFFKILILFRLLAAVEAELKCYGTDCKEQCSGMECESKETLLAMISHYQKEKHDDYLAPLTKSISTEVGAIEEPVAPECSICSQPGLCSTGKCVADTNQPWKKYHCVCPDNTSGRQCENVIQCETNSCGKNAICYVANHQLNCVCKPGYKARRNKTDCDIKVQKACMKGDPHYTTYDGLRFDYQGTCPYVFSKPCKTRCKTASNLWYSVRAKNKVSGNKPTVSIVSEVEVDMYNFTVHVDGRLKTVLVNGVEVLTPWYYPNKSNWIVRVRRSGAKFTIENDQGIMVTFITDSLCVEVPDIPEFQGQTTLCGLAGNIDGNKFDDVVHKNGTILNIKSSRQPERNNLLQFMKFEDSWITDQFLVLREGQENCINGQSIDDNSTCSVEVDAQKCYPIMQARSGLGAFGACKALDNDTIGYFYSDCTYDVCHDPAYRCTALADFFHYCQSALPRVQQNPNWRAEVGCPLACPLNAHASICASSCPPTCAEPNPETCDQACMDGCECDPGYVIDNTVAGSDKCVRLDQCGCVDQDGNAHKPGKPWLTQNCTIYNECQNGTIRSKPRPCSDHGTCTADMTCECNSGYRGDGYNCTSIDKCAEAPGMCGKHGKCVNTPESYHCECDPFWVGDHCNSYKPRRHCADVYVYWGERTDGVYTVNPPFALQKRAPLTPIDVYCDMTTNGGGYTLMSSDSGNLNSNKTYQEYINGFGTPATQNLWLGLEFIHQLTTYQPHSSRQPAPMCQQRTTAEIYRLHVPEVPGPRLQYPVFRGHKRGLCWKRGRRYLLSGRMGQMGPDSKRTQVLHLGHGGRYSEYLLKEWLQHGMVVRYTCPDIPVESQRYLRWGQGTLGQASMYLRPVGYPKYDTTQ